MRVYYDVVQIHGNMSSRGFRRNQTDDLGINSSRSDQWSHACTWGLGTVLAKISPHLDLSDAGVDMNACRVLGHSESPETAAGHNVGDQSGWVTFQRRTTPTPLVVILSCWLHNSVYLLYVLPNTYNPSLPSHDLRCVHLSLTNNPHVRFAFHAFEARLLHC